MDFPSPHLYSVFFENAGRIDEDSDWIALLWYMHDNGSHVNNPDLTLHIFAVIC